MTPPRIAIGAAVACEGEPAAAQIIDSDNTSPGPETTQLREVRNGGTRFAG